MKNQVKKIIATCAAVAFSVSFFAACAPTSENTYEEEGFSVVADYNDGVSRPRTYYTSEGGSINEPAVPEREGYTITGWYTAQEGGEKITFPYTPSSDGTIYAQWQAEMYDVTFDFNFVVSTPYVQQIAYNETVDRPSDDIIPEHEGYSFYRWETLPEGGDAVTFPYTIRNDTTFYAAWLEEGTSVYTVSFDVNYEDYEGDPVIDTIDVVEGGSITSRQAPDDPDRAGYEFLGWATTPDASEPDVEFPYTPSGNVTLYAVWEQQTYLVRFRYNYTDAPGGLAQAYYETRVPGGTMVEAPEADPVREGFEFAGWYTANAGGTEVEFPYNVTRASTFYAHWRANSMTPENNIFDAEFTPISPNYASPTYSGNATGTQIITQDAEPGGDGYVGAYTDPSYPILGDQRAGARYYVGALYVQGASLTFTIYSSERVTGVSLYAALAVEIIPNVVITPSGQYGFEFIVNGTSLNYGSIDLTRPNVTPGTMHHSAFDEYLVANNITLNEGENTIVLRVNNATQTPEMGAMTAMAPLVDYIRLETSASLTWHPEYDNLYRQT